MLLAGRGQGVAKGLSLTSPAPPESCGHFASCPGRGWFVQFFKKHSEFKFLAEISPCLSADNGPNFPKTFESKSPPPGELTSVPGPPWGALGTALSKAPGCVCPCVDCPSFPGTLPCSELHTTYPPQSLFLGGQTPASQSVFHQRYQSSILFLPSSNHRHKRGPRITEPQGWA